MGKQCDEQQTKPKVPQEIWILVAAAFLIALGYGLIAPIIPQFAQSFDVGVAAAGAVVSIFAFSRLLFAPVSGRLVDRLGSRRIYISGLVIVAVTTGLVALTAEYWQMMTLRARRSGLHDVHGVRDGADYSPGAAGDPRSLLQPVRHGVFAG